jgi:hypothetical protein
MLRKLFIGVLCLTLAWTSLVIDPSYATPQTHFNGTYIAAATSAVTDGRFAVQQAAYNDADGEYTLMLLGTQPGQSPTYRSTDLQMARTGDDEPIAGTYLSLEGGQAVLHLTEDFRIEYVHAVTETQANPQTGQTETVIVRRESNFWTPFAGVIAGQMVGNALFGPRYYVPPMYSAGSPLVGYGGVGSTYSGAVSSYQEKHNSPPPAVKNRTTLRTSGNLRSSQTPSRSTGFGSKTRDAASPTAQPNANNRMKSSGSGFGASNLRSTKQAPAPSRMQRRSSGFGSGGGARRPMRSFGRRR